MRDPRPDQVPSLTGEGRVPADPMTALLLSSIDGRAALAELAEASGMSVEMACRIAAALRRDGIIRLHDSQPPGEKAAAAPVPEGAGGAAEDAQKKDAAARALGEEVDAFEAEIGGRNYYEILSLDPGADRAAVRSSYFQLSKKFHPDRAFGPRSAELRRKMEGLFTLLTRAYETLSAPKERAQYDAYIADQIELWRIEQQLVRAAAAPKAREGSAGSPSRSAPARPTVPAVRVSPARRQPPRDQSVSSQPPERSRPSGERVSTPPPDAAERRASWRKERAERTLGAILTQAPPSARQPTARDLGKRIDQAALAIENGKFSDAVRVLQEVLAVDDSQTRARELLQQAETGALHELSLGYVRQGRYERQHGNADLAVAHFEKAISVNAENIDARHQLAEVLLERRTDLPRALKLCREVIGLGGQRAKYFATLGEILLLSKDKPHAAEAFERALRIEPDNKEIMKKLKLCRT